MGLIGWKTGQRLVAEHWSLHISSGYWSGRHIAWYAWVYPCQRNVKRLNDVHTLESDSFKTLYEHSNNIFSAQWHKQAFEALSISPKNNPLDVAEVVEKNNACQSCMLVDFLRIPHNTHKAEEWLWLPGRPQVKALWSSGMSTSACKTDCGPDLPTVFWSRG